MFQNANGEWKEYIYLLPSYYKHQAFILVFKFLSFYLYNCRFPQSRGVRAY
jgi:hypothetical protein